MPIADSKSPPSRIPPFFLAIAFSWVHDSPAKTATSSLTHSSVDYVIKLLLMDLVEMMGIPSMSLILKKMSFLGFPPFSLPRYGTQTWQWSHSGKTDEETVLGWKELPGRKLTSWITLWNRVWLPPGQPNCVTEHSTSFCIKPLYFGPFSLCQLSFYPN